MKPLVSIVIPTHERPDYLALALKSVQHQTYENLQIIIADNSTQHDVRAMLAEQLQGDPRITFLSKPTKGLIENWRNGLVHATGEYVNLLMDDDLFHPRKVERMVQAFAEVPSAGVVTSYRELIDTAGQPLPPMQGTQRLFEKDTVLSGTEFGNFLLKNGQNLVGEPTTAMYRRTDLVDGFGRFGERQYMVLTDLATWLKLMHGRHCVYLSEALSYFRIHEGQDQRQVRTALHAQLEWLELLLEAHRQGLYMTDKQELRVHVAAKLPRLVAFLAERAETIREGDYDVQRIQQLVKAGFDAILH